MSEKVENLRIRVMEKMARRFACQTEGIFATELLREFEGAVREDERIRPQPVPVDMVQVAMEALYEWFDDTFGHSTTGYREKFGTLLIRLCQELRLDELKKRSTTPFYPTLYPIEASAGQIEKSEMYQKMVSRTIYWRERYELAVRGLTDEVGREP